MSEWTKLDVKLPGDGDLVEIRTNAGQRVKPVEFYGGRFWKVRQGNGGHAYEVEAWRPIEQPKIRRDDGSAKGID